MGALDSHIESEFEKTHIPAMGVIVVDAENEMFAKTYGECTSLDSSYILGSVSKSFTAASVMQLAEKGKLELSKPIADYLPEVNKDCKTTVKQLLNQTSGIETYMTLHNYTSSDVPVPYQYANVNYDLLGQIIENVSGMGYADYIKTQIFEPLEMTKSFVSLEAAKEGGLIEGHRNYFGLMVKEEMNYPVSPEWLTLSSAYLISNPKDMGKYLQFYLNGGEGVLSPDSIRTMHSDTTFVQEDYEYGMGWGLDNRADEPVLLHGGNVENYTTNMFILPERGLGVMVMYNACDYLVANGMANQLSYNIVYKLIGAETADIENAAYFRSHLLINDILLLVLFISILPLIRLKKWCVKNKGQIKARGILAVVLGHAVLPTLFLTAFVILGIPMFVVSDFAPDVFMVQVISSIFLYATGVFKIAYWVKGRRGSE